MVIGKGQGRGQVRGKGRGLCHVEDCVRPIVVDEGDDTGMLSSSPPVAGESHPSQEQSNDSPSFGVAPTTSCKGIYCIFLIICCIHFVNYFAIYN
jgi:hypothetical protein